LDGIKRERNDKNKRWLKTEVTPAQLLVFEPHDGEIQNSVADIKILSEKFDFVPTWVRIEVNAFLHRHHFKLLEHPAKQFLFAFPAITLSGFEFSHRFFGITFPAVEHSKVVLCVAAYCPALYLAFVCDGIPRNHF
jgi:hypothetical protein